jgi:hypothetical protein
MFLIMSVSLIFLPSYMLKKSHLRLNFPLLFFFLSLRVGDQTQGSVTEVYTYPFLKILF